MGADPAIVAGLEEALTALGEHEPALRSRLLGRLATELRIEAHAWRADLIGLAAPERPGPRHRFRAWYLARTVSIPVVLLPIDRADAGHRRRGSRPLPARVPLTSGTR